MVRSASWVGNSAKPRRVSRVMALMCRNPALAKKSLRLPIIESERLTDQRPPLRYRSMTACSMTWRANQRTPVGVSTHCHGIRHVHHEFHSRRTMHSVGGAGRPVEAVSTRLTAAPDFRDRFRGPLGFALQRGRQQHVTRSGQATMLGALAPAFGHQDGARPSWLMLAHPPEVT
jgi:hypothetical protein